MRSAMVANKLGLKLPEWQGALFQELLSEKEQNDYKACQLLGGSLTGVEA